MESKEKIIRNFKNKILARADYNKSLHYSVHDFLDPNDLIHLLYELLSHEIYLTTDGFEFLKRYYGFKGIIKLIKKHGGELAKWSDEDLVKWLKKNNGMPKIEDNTFDLSVLFKKKN